MLDTVIKNYTSEKVKSTEEKLVDQIPDDVLLDGNLTAKKPEKEGLESIAKNLFKFSGGRLTQLEHFRAPQRKLMIMILGNHSAGKSSFINWYIGENMQKTGVSIETVEINMVTHGNEIAELNGQNLMKQFPFMKELQHKGTKTERYPGLLANLSVKVCTSKQRNFEDIVFVDTPGLADGSLRYKFNVEDAYQWLARHCDMVLVFLDPIGQALC